MKKLTYLIVGLLVIGTAQAQQPSRLTNEFFPDPDVTFDTPAFESPMGFTKYKELTAFLENLAAANEYATLEYFGETQKGRQIPLIRVAKPGDTPKVKVWMQGGIHGNEPASSEGMLVVIQELLTAPKNAYLLDRLEIIIVPMVNIDGYMQQNRLAKNGLDLNRDLIKLQVKETQQLRERYSKYSPHVAIDFHEYNPFRASFRDLGSMGYTSFYDAMFLYSGDLNIEPEIRTLTEDLFVQNAKKEFDEMGFKHHDYFSPQDYRGKLYFNLGSSSARSSATSFALGNAVSILMEIRGSRLNRKSFERRVLITKTAAFSYLETAYGRNDEVLNGLNKAITSTLSMEREVVATSKRTREVVPIKFIDIAENEMVESDFEVASSKSMTPVIVRQRPKAYLLPPDQNVAIKNLMILGVKVDTLETNQSFAVESYQVLKQDIEVSKYQGYYPKSVTTEVINQERAFEKGSFMIRLDQKNANLAITALEPESDNGFVKTRVIETEMGKNIPIYRLMTQAPSPN